MSKLIASLTAVLLLCLLATAEPAFAGNIRAGFGGNSLPANDDNSTGLLPLGFTLNFYGNFESGLYVNNNGNLTFETPLSNFTPVAFASTNAKIIAPFWADVQTTGAGSALTAYGAGSVDGHNAFGATWDGVGVGYYNDHTDKLNKFQVLLIDRSDIQASDFDIELNYDQIQWETGDASGGTNGLGGASAAVGFSAGNGDTYYQMPGSMVPGSFLDGNSTGGLIHSSNIGVPGRFLYEFRNGALTPTPEPSTLVLLGLGAISAFGRIWFRTRRYRRNSLTIACTPLLLLLGVNQSAQAVQYHITDLGSLGGSSYAYSVNNSGQVAGDSLVGGHGRAFRYSGSTMSNLGTLGGSYSTAFGINDSGRVVGESTTALGNMRAFLYSGSTMTDLGTLGGSYSSASGINDLGLVVGQSTTASGDSHTFVSDGEMMLDLNTQGANFNEAKAINNSGFVAGNSFASGGALHASLYNGSATIDLGTLGGQNSYASGINNSGQVIGYSKIAGNTATHPFLYSGSTLIDLGSFGGAEGIAQGINDSGQVVGYSDTATGSRLAFLYNGSTLTNLNTLLDSSGAGWTLYSATDINNLGRIVGTGWNPSGQNHAFLLTPVPEPSTLVLLGLGVLGLLGYARRRRIGKEIQQSPPSATGHRPVRRREQQ